MTAVVLAPVERLSNRYVVDVSCPVCGVPMRSRECEEPCGMVRRQVLSCHVHGEWRLTVTLTAVQHRLDDVERVA